MLSPGKQIFIYFGAAAHSVISPTLVNCFSYSQAILLEMKYCSRGFSKSALSSLYGKFYSQQIFGEIFLLTYFSFIVLFQTQGGFPAKASFFSLFLAKGRLLQTSFPPPLNAAHHDDSPKDTLEGFALIHILLNSPRSEKDLH